MRCRDLALLAICLAPLHTRSEPVARISRVDGSAELLRADARQWRTCKVNTPLQVGDQVFCRAESFAEIRYSNGEILRMNEESKIVIEQATAASCKTRNALGDVWVNMKRLSGNKRNFEVSTPTAVAAIRGTIFRMAAGADSSTLVSVYDGKVAVGPGEKLNTTRQGKGGDADPGARTEVPGPQEVPGPFEVTLEQWQTIVSGQRISVRSDGRFATEAFDTKDSDDQFVKMNLELDSSALIK